MIWSFVFFSWEMSDEVGIMGGANMYECTVFRVFGYRDLYVVGVLRGG